jgi:hypothetical protein
MRTTRSLKRRKPPRYRRREAVLAATLSKPPHSK